MTAALGRCCSQRCRASAAGCGVARSWKAGWDRAGIARGEQEGGEQEGGTEGEATQAGAQRCGWYSRAGLAALLCGQMVAKILPPDPPPGGEDGDPLDSDAGSGWQRLAGLPGRGPDQGWPESPVAAPAALPPGTRVYAIGDIHGCLNRLVSLHFAIAADLARHPVTRSVLIHLGDYVDRGPDSAGVLWLLSGAVAPKVSERVDLRGNHEAMMQAALAEAASPEEVRLWLDNGGDKALASYGISPQMPRAEWPRHIPALHLSWLAARPSTHAEGGYLFVHAGIRPGIALAEQDPEDLIWIRDPFLYSREAHPLVVVHGHSMVRAPELLKNRIGIDTGAVMGNRLSCLVLEGSTLRFLTA